MSIPWDDTYLLHLPVIDAQHRQLFAILSELETALAGDLSPTAAEHLLLRLQHYAARHFAIEERYMEESHFPGLEQQRQAHRKFSATFTRVFDESRAGGISPSLAPLMERELSQWLRDHVAGLDQSFAVFYGHFLEELKGGKTRPP